MRKTSTSTQGALHSLCWVLPGQPCAAELVETLPPPRTGDAQAAQELRPPAPGAGTQDTGRLVTVWAPTAWNGQEYYGGPMGGVGPTPGCGAAGR